MRGIEFCTFCKGTQSEFKLSCSGAPTRAYRSGWGLSGRGHTASPVLCCASQLAKRCAYAERSGGKREDVDAAQAWTTAMITGLFVLRVSRLEFWLRPPQTAGAQCEVRAGITRVGRGGGAGNSILVVGPFEPEQRRPGWNQSCSQNGYVLDCAIVELALERDARGR